jgi:hypothetical protein
MSRAVQPHHNITIQLNNKVMKLLLVIIKYYMIKSLIILMLFLSLMEF